MQGRILVRRSFIDPSSRLPPFDRIFSTVVAFSRPRFQRAAQSTEKTLTIDALFAHGPLIGQPPAQLTWSPDGKHLTYIDGGELIDLDPGTGKPHVLVSRAKMASLTERRRLRAGPRPSRPLQDGQLHLGA